MAHAEQFEELRPLLFSIAYRILGSVSEAEDAVQETWLRYAGSGVRPDSPKAYLATVVTRVSIDVLRSARVRRETYVGPWLPEPLLTDEPSVDPYRDPERAADLADSASMATLLVLERLSPLERAVFVLREVFGFGFAEIGAVVDRSEAACRQLASRARRHMRSGRPRFEADRRKRLELADRFFDALSRGDLAGLQALLAADVATVNDGGGKGGGQGVTFGAVRVARILVATAPSLLAAGAQLERRDVNGNPGAVIRDAGGHVVAAWSLDILDGQVQMIRSVTNPDKLRHLGVPGDIRALVRERNRLRRSRRDSTRADGGGT